MCKGKSKCSCGCAGPKRIKANLVSGEARRALFNGEAHLVVPVIMARSDVPMNGGIIPVEEMDPISWNGVPVTVGHPANADNGFIPANTPETLEQWAVGQIFNSSVADGVLRAEAWVNIKKAQALDPSLIYSLTRGVDMDVSTGYFCEVEPTKGVVNGREFEEYHRDLKPEHLALLPHEEGACSFADGCGVRRNGKGKFAMTLEEFLKRFKANAEELQAAVLNGRGKKPTKKPAARRNERGSDDDGRQIMADLISRNESPFTPDDEMGLAAMSAETLKKMRDTYLPAPGENNEDDENAVNEETVDEVVTDNEDDGVIVDSEDDEDMANKNAKKNSAAFDVAGLTKALSTFQTNMLKAVKDNGLTAEEREALKELRANKDKQRGQLIDQIIANTDMAKADLDKLDAATLQIIANGTRARNYGGRAAPVVIDDKAEESLKVMTAGVVNTTALIQAQRKAG